MPANDWNEVAERARWSAAADYWRQTAESSAAQAAKLSRYLIEALAPKPSDHILDLACGAGEPGLTLAAMVGDAGLVIGLDPVLPMLQTGRDRAVAAQLNRFVAVAGDFTQLPLPPQSIDAVCCRFGLMFVDDLITTAKEIARVLKPHGRFGAMIWGPLAGNAGWCALRDVAAPILGPDAIAAIDSPFRLADPAPLLNALTTAGLEQVSLQTLALGRAVRPDADALEDLLQKALGHLLTPKTADQIRAGLVEWLVTRAGPDGLTPLPVTVHLVTALAPAD